MALTDRAAHPGEKQRQQFLSDGFMRIDGAFPADVAAEGRAILWRDTGCDPNDRSTWTRPVVRLGDYPHPFGMAVNTPVLQAAFDDFVGEDRWEPRQSLGTFPVRFPHPDDPGDTGWHVDASFPPEGASDSYFEWRVNVRSRGRALLMLFLFSDVGNDDAPTRIRMGSHLAVARLLAPAGDAGMSMLDISRAAETATRCAGASWDGAALYGPAAASAEGALRIDPQPWELFAGGAGDPEGPRHRRPLMKQPAPGWLRQAGCARRLTFLQGHR